MSRIKRSDTKPELSVRKYLYAKGYRYKIKNRLFGKPDIVFSANKVVVFVNGCFWHRHKNCEKSYLPKTNKKFWLAKFKRNVSRDKQVDKKLINENWNVIRIWECEIEHNLRQAILPIIKELDHAKI